MEIMTLLKANIRKKKGVFISIAVLMAIITAVATAIFSVRDNYGKGFARAYETAGAGDCVIMMSSDSLTEELRRAVENHELVDHVDYYDSLCGNGISCGQAYDSNTFFMMELREGIMLFNEDADGLEQEIPEPGRGEIYLPLGLKAKLNCNVGDTVTVDMIFGVKADFTIKGFVQEPSFGAMTIGWKCVFINRDDFEKIYRECLPLKTENILLRAAVLSVHQAEGSGLSSIKFQRELNLDTKIVDVSKGALNRDQSVRYSTLLPDIILDIMLVFIIFLFVIILIVMSHSIGTEIETDYTTLGILKALGFDNVGIRLLFFLQYIFAEALGILAGVIAAVPIERAVSGDVSSVTGILPDTGLSVGRSMLYILVIVVCSAAVILFKSRKVVRISPVRAIAEGRDEIYFDSRFNAPVTKKGLSASLALRQFTSGSRRYIGTVIIAAILVFFMITVNLVGVMMSSRVALKAMGVATPDIELFYTEETEEDCIGASEKIIESRCAILEKNSMCHMYSSLNGENLCCEVYKYPEYIDGIIKGREPRYQNEILITEMVAESLDLKIGDKVRVSHGDKDAEYLISGFFQSTYDSGMTFAMNFDGADEIGINTRYAYAYYTVDDKTKLPEIVEEIKGKYGDLLGINVYDEGDNPVEFEYMEIVDFLKIIIYSFSVLFAFVVIRMVCVKIFIQERRDIGIYKAVGFTSGGLRRSFALRFLLVALAGAAVGTVLSFLFSERLTGAALSLMGLSKVVFEFTVPSVLVPVGAISLAFLLFSYLASGKIRRVEIRELVAE